MSLTPLNKPSLVDLTEERLCNFVRELGLGVGDSLPPELELAKRLDVSRSVVREALSRLRMIGLVESRKKRGMVMSRPQVFTGLANTLNHNLLDTKQVAELLEMRLVLEVGMADFLIKRLKSSDIQELQNIVADEEVDPHDPERIRAVDRAFHTYCYRVVGNHMLEDLQEKLAHFFDSKVYEIELKRRQKDNQHPRHSELLELMKQRQVEAYRHAIVEHLKPHFKILGIEETVQFST